MRRRSRRNADDMEQMITTIQVDRELLQENIRMRVQYGWAFIALIVTLLIAISLPREISIDYEPLDMFVLAIVCFVSSIALIFMGLFSSHYGSSYMLFSSDGPISGDELLVVEQSLHRKTLYKNQLSSLYNGESILVAFVGVMVLVVASEYNIFNGHEYHLIMISMMCMFFAGSFFKKRMYRMYQIDPMRLPGKGPNSFFGHISRILFGMFVRNWCWLDGHVKRRPGFGQDERIKEMKYGSMVVITAVSLFLVLSVISWFSTLQSLEVIMLLFFSAIVGFSQKHLSMTIMANLDPSKGLYNPVSYNGMYKVMTFYRVLLDALFFVAMIYIFYLGGDVYCTVALSGALLLVIVLFYIHLWRRNNYLAVLRMNRFSEKGSTSILKMQDLGVRYIFNPTNGYLRIQTSRKPTPCESKLIMFSIEFMLPYIPKMKSLDIHFPTSWNSDVRYHHSRTDLKVKLEFDESEGPRIC